MARAPTGPGFEVTYQEISRLVYPGGHMRRITIQDCRKISQTGDDWVTRLSTYPPDRRLSCRVQWPEATGWDVGFVAFGTQISATRAQAMIDIIGLSWIISRSAIPIRREVHQNVFHGGSGSGNDVGPSYKIRRPVILLQSKNTLASVITSTPLSIQGSHGLPAGGYNTLQLLCMDFLGPTPPSS